MSVRANIPSLRYPALSITGSRCMLHCKYCMGHYLKGIIPVSSPRKLSDTANKRYRRGLEGCLISGVLTQKEIKCDFGFVSFLPCGLIDREILNEMKETDGHSR